MKLANPGSSGKMAVEMDRESSGVVVEM